MVDPDTFFSSPSHDSALNALAGGFARRDPAVLIDGTIGVGKSFVARKWLEQLPPEVPRIVLPNAHAEKPASLLQAILFDLGKPYQGLTEQELRLSVTDHLFLVAAESPHPIVLILDEAQHLSHSAIEELRLLGNLQTHQGPVLFTVLVAQTTLRDAFRRPAYELFVQRLAAQIAVEPLTPTESADYLRHQLRSAGGEPESIFDETAIAMLAGACNGIPRVLNRAAALALELAASAEAEVVDVEAGLEALDRLGLTPQETEASEADELSDAILLPHPARAEEPPRPRRGKSADAANGDEADVTPGPKDKASRKRTV